jgi:hypothetical protein
MYDKHIIFDNSLRNVVAGKEVTGFSIGARLPYYRSQTLSGIEDIVITVDGAKAPRASVRFSVRGKTWSLDEMETVVDERWEFGEVATVTVLQPGGLSPGKHEVSAMVQQRISYLPWSPQTTCVKSMVAAA